MMFWMGGIGDSVHLPLICPFKDFFFTVVTTTHGQSPIQGGGVVLSKVHPLAQITHMSTDAGFKVRRLNSVGNTEDGREFHKTEVVGKKEAPQRTSLELPLSLIHISEPTRLLSISYAVFCLKKKKKFFFFFFFFNDTATTEIYTRSLVGSVRCV